MSDEIQVVDESGEVVENPDLEAGYIENNYLDTDGKGTIVLQKRIYHVYTPEQLEQVQKDKQAQQLSEQSTAFFLDGGKSKMEQDIKDAAASGGETNPQIMKFAALALAPMASTLTDEQIMSVSSLWPEWSPDSVAYKTDDVVQYSNKLWRCEQAHTSQSSWTPDAAPSLWSQIDIADDGIDVWTQPTGAHNAYNTGDRVHYPDANGPIYVSTIDGNVWSPDAYPQGWKLDGEGSGPEEPEEPGGETYSEWKQPTGAHDAYSKGDKVSHNGKNWVSDVDGNVWEPGVYGWTEE